MVLMHAVMLDIHIVLCTVTFWHLTAHYFTLKPRPPIRFPQVAAMMLMHQTPQKTAGYLLLRSPSTFTSKPF
jgi:hypothetical protein